MTQHFRSHADEALAAFRARLKERGEPDLTGDAGGNPLPASLEIALNDPLDTARVADALRTIPSSAEIERIIAPRPAIPPGANWQTPQDLHTRPAFADFVKLVEMAARGVARYLQVDQYPMMITGCWANINPQGAYHPTHAHPNNYLSGVYYVAAPPPTRIVFQDPRPSMIMPKPSIVSSSRS